MKLIISFLCLISFQALAQFFPGQVIDSSQINQEFFKIQNKLVNRGPYIFNYEEVQENEKIQSVQLNQFSPDQPIQASQINENFSVINQVILSSLS